jgi:hypothetical protein
VPVNGTALTQGTTVSSNFVVAVGAATTFTDTGLTPETGYTYEVYAYNGSGTGIVYSVTALTGNVTTGAATPAAPTALNFTSTTATEVGGSFTPSVAAGYVVLRRLTGTAAYVPVNGTALTQGTTVADNFVLAVGTNTSFTDPGLTPETGYTYEVYAYNGSGTGIVYSTTALTGNVTTIAATPAAPTVLVLNLTSATEVAGSFTGSGAAGYVVLRRPATATAYVPVNGTALLTGNTPAADNTVVTSGPNATFNDSGLANATEYVYSVYAYNGSGTGIVYSPTTLTGPITTRAAEPQEQGTALSLSFNLSKLMTGSFTGSANGAGGYLVLRYITPATRTAPIDGTSYTVGDTYANQQVVHAGAGVGFTDDLAAIANGTVINYDVYAYNGSGTTINYLTTSPLASSRTLEAGGATTPTAAAASEATTFSIRANWAAAEGADSYQLEVAADAGFTNLLPGFGPLSTTSTSAVVGGLYHATQYFYRVRGVKGTEQTAYSNTIIAKTLKSAELTADSTALVRIYDQMGGTGWTASTGWKTAQVRGWLGVVVENSRVVGLNLPASNVTGTFPALSETELTVLRQLDLSANALTSFTYSANLAALQTVNLSANRLHFGDLEPLAGVASFTYAPQGEVLTATSVLQERGQELTLDRTVPGSTNSYQWLRDGTAIEGATAASYTIAFPTFAEEGAYSATVTNSQLPALTLTTAPINVRVSSLERDRLVLTELYNNTGGPNWTNSTNWTTDDVSTWFGVTVTDNRVTALNLPNNNLTGDLPATLGDLRRLTAIDLSNNQLSSLPPLTNIIALATLNVSNNKLDFGDLEPNIGIGSMVYAPQKAIGTGKDERLPVNTAYTLDVQVGGSANSYQWYLNGVAVPGATSSQLPLAALRYENMGSYELEVTSTAISDLTLRSEVQRVLATATLSGSIVDNDGVGVGNATGTLLGIRTGAYDNTAVYQSDGGGVYQIAEVVLGDYLLYAEQDLTVYIPSYYQRTIDWVFADVIALRDNSGGINLTMERIPAPLTPADGDNTLAGTLESDFGDEGGKVLNRQRVRGAGVTVSRPRFRAKDNEDEVEYELVVYVQTDENGEFEINNLPDGDYRLNIQYPGIPMDPTSFVDFTLGGGAGVEQNSITVSALATPEGIVVSKVEETGIYLDYFKNLAVYPNPAANQLTIRYEKLVKGRVVAELLDLTGQTMLRVPVATGQQQQQTELDLTDIREGVYILRFVDQQGQGADITFFRIIVRK